MNGRDAPSRADRTAGALLGVHAGDALGATLEFHSWSRIRDLYPDGLTDIVGGGPFDWPAGHATDDTDLTRAVLLAYLEPGDDVVAVAADAMLDWLDGQWPGRVAGQRPRDIGAATSSGLERYRSTRDPRAAGAGIGRAGNGSLMRCIPTALAVHDRERRIRESIEISAITHDDPRCTAACAVYNEIAATLLGGAVPADAVHAGRETAAELGSADVAAAIQHGQELDLRLMAATGEIPLPDGGAGYVLDSLTLAVAAALDRRSFPNVLVDVIRLGNDTDTNGAIAGGLLGARDGVDAIPTRWIAVLQFAAEFSSAAERLSGAYA
ncbi:MAG TPA: ADP-ribosylglycohydrolase family protein [Jiangellaceae bacterium]